MSMMISENWANELDPVLRKIFFTSLEKVNPRDKIMEQLFTMESSSRQIERVSGVGGLADIPEFAGSFTEDSAYEQYLKTFTHTEYGRKMTIEKKLLEDDLQNVIASRPKKLALAWHRTRQKLGASVFNNAVNAGVTGADSVALGSASHPTKSPDGITQSNLGTNSLSASGLITTMNAMNGFRDDRGELMAVSPTLLVVPLALRQTALEIVGSEKEPYGPDNTINVARKNIEGSMFKVITWNRLTDSNMWFTIDEDMMKESLLWYDRIKAELNRDEDFDHRAAKWSLYARCSFGFCDWRWVYVNNPS